MYPGLTGYLLKHLRLKIQTTQHVHYKMGVGWGWGVERVSILQAALELIPLSSKCRDYSPGLPCLVLLSVKNGTQSLRKHLSTELQLLKLNKYM